MRAAHQRPGVIAMADSPRSFWQTAPGMFTAIAALITAIAGLIGILVQAGVIGGDSSSADRGVDRSTSSGPRAGRGGSTAESEGRSPGTTAPADAATLVPWEEATATLIRQDGTSTSVKAATVGLACNTDVVKLKNGQEIDLKLVGSIRFDTIYTENASADGVVVLLDGRKVAGPIFTWNCPVQGSNELGTVTVALEDIKRIDFDRVPG